MPPNLFRCFLSNRLKACYMNNVKIYKAVPLGNKRYKLGEGPFWNEETKSLSFVDITAGCFYIMDEKQNLQSFEMGQMIGAAVPTDISGTFLLAATDGLYLLKNGKAEKLYDLTNDYKPYHRSNDAKADPKGRLFVGSIVFDGKHDPSGNLYCFDGKLSVVQPDTLLANGMAWSHDRKKFYFSDSEEHGIFEYDYDEEKGTITNRKKLFSVTNMVPDGMCIDSDDNLWVAVWGGHRIECHSTKNGELLAIIEVDATNVTSCCFCGETGKMYITTSGDGREGENEGKIFTCTVDATGVKNDVVCMERYLNGSTLL